MAWPHNNAKPMAFLAQINLSELAKHDLESPLPTQGLLTFFYDQWNETWGFDPNDRGSWLVRLLDSSSLERREPPQGTMGVYGEGDRYHASALEMHISVSLPNWEHDVVQRTLNEEERQHCDGVYDRLFGEEDSGGGGDASVHQIFGYPFPIQHPHIDQECILVSSGFNMGGPVEDPAVRERMEQTLRDADDWDLILQIDTDEDGPGWMWGDVGMLYFYAPRREIREGRFENAWCVLQCC